MADEKELEVIKVGQDVTAVSTTDDIISLAERRIAKVQKIIGISLQITNAGDWVDQEGKPYLMGSGAEKVARLFGVKIKSVQSRKIDSEDEKGKFYFYETTGIAELPGGFDAIEALGTCSSKDVFFAKSHGEWKPLSEIDETNIMKASYTNFLANAITRLLGLRNLTWEQLAQANIHKDNVAKIERNVKKEVSEEGKDLRTKSGDMILELCNNDKTEAANYLERLTTFEITEDGKKKTIKGKRSMADLSEKQINLVYGKVKKAYEAVGRSPGEEG